MSRKTSERRRLAEERWPLLSNLMASYFCQDFEAIDGSLSAALTAAINDGSVEHRRAVLEEWWDWNASNGAAQDIRPFLTDAFGVEVNFETSSDARKFMNQIYDGLKSV